MNLDSATNWATILGILVALAAYVSDRQRAERERQRSTFLESNARYLEYLKLCLERTDLDCFEIASDDPRLVSSDLTIEQMIAYSMLISMLETSFILYGDQSGKTRRRQWSGWEDYIKTWLERASFRRAWSTLSEQFDSAFVEYVDRLIRQGRTANALHNPNAR